MVTRPNLDIQGTPIGVVPPCCRGAGAPDAGRLGGRGAKEDQAGGGGPPRLWTAPVRSVCAATRGLTRRRF